MSHLFFFSFPRECSSQVDFFGNMLRVFHSRILSTLRCKFVQFLVFYACTKSPYIYSQIFLSSLLNVFKDMSLDQHARASAVLYMGSFVARFAELSPDTICSVLSGLCEWGREYIAKLPKDSTPDPEKFHLFYVVFNCILYMLCFRSKDVLKKMNDVSCVERTIDFLINCQLNPMLFVQENIRKEIFCVKKFEKLVASIETKLAKNKKLILPSTVSRAGMNIAFPFDPILLSGSEARLAKFYKQWTEYDDEGDEQMRDAADIFSRSSSEMKKNNSTSSSNSSGSSSNSINRNTTFNNNNNNNNNNNSKSNSNGNNKSNKIVEFQYSEMEEYDEYGVEPMEEDDDERAFAVSFGTPVTGSFGEHTFHSSSAGSPNNHFCY